MSVNGHSKGKGPLKLYEDSDQKQKKWHPDKIGLLVGGYVLARPEQEPEWHLAQVTEVEPLKMPEDQFQAHNDEHYRYYVTFPEYNRRWDCYLPRGNINVDTEAIQKALWLYERKKAEEESNEEKKRIFENDEHQGMDERTMQAHINATKVKNISRIVFGDNITPTWYYSPYPEPYHNVETLYICEYCLGYFGCNLAGR